MKHLKVLSLCIILVFLLGCNNASTDEQSTDEDINEHYVTSRTVYREDGQILEEYTYDEYINEDFKHEIEEKDRAEYNYANDGVLLSIDWYFRGELRKDDCEKFSYNDNGDLLRHTKGDQVLEKYEYDDSGNCIYEETFKNGNTYHCEYKYTNGVLTSTYEEYEGIREVDDDDDEEEDDDTQYVTVSSYYNTDYDSQGRPTKVQCFENDDVPYVEVYSYSSDSETISTYSLSNELDSVYIVKYDSSGRVIMKEMKLADSDEYYWRHEYEYDGINYTDTYYSKADGLTNSEVFKFDANGSLITETHYDPDGNPTASWEYEYDDHNMVTKITKKSDGTTEISYGPERKYYENGQIKEIVCYNDVEYIFKDYYTEPPTAEVSEEYF